MTELVFSSQVSKRFTRRGGREEGGRKEGQAERWGRKLIPLAYTHTHTRFLFRERNCVTDAKMPLGKGVCVCDSWSWPPQRGIGLGGRA